MTPTIWVDVSWPELQLFGGFVKYREPIFEAGVLQLYIYIFKSQYRWHHWCLFCLIVTLLYYWWYLSFVLSRLHFELVHKPCTKSPFYIVYVNKYKIVLICYNCTRFPLYRRKKNQSFYECCLFVLSTTYTITCCGGFAIVENLESLWTVLYRRLSKLFLLEGNLSSPSLFKDPTTLFRLLTVQLLGKKTFIASTLFAFSILPPLREMVFRTQNSSVTHPRIVNLSGRGRVL